MKKSNSIKYLVQYYIFLSSIMLIQSIPRKIGIYLMRTLAILFYQASKKHRNNTIRHLTIAFGNEKSEKEIKKIALNVFKHFAGVIVDIVRIPLFLKEGIDQYVTVENMSIFEQYCQKGKGVLLLTGHFGNWEMMGAWMIWKKHPLMVVSAPLPNPKLNRLLVEAREQVGFINIERGKNTLKLVKKIKQGYPLGILIDQDTHVKGIFVDFFGKKANTPVGPIILARRFNIPIIPAFMYLKKDLTYHLEFQEPFEFSNTGDAEKDIMSDVQRCTHIYEKMIRKHPEQWAWMHRRWKRSPNG